MKLEFVCYELKGSMEELFRDSFSKLKLSSDNKVIWEWNYDGKRGSVSAKMEYSVCDGAWHSVVLERNPMEVILLFDRKIVAIKENMVNMEHEEEIDVSEIQVWPGSCDVLHRILNNMLSCFIVSKLSPLKDNLIIYSGFILLSVPGIFQE